LFVVFVSGIENIEEIIHEYVFFVLLYEIEIRNSSFSRLSVAGTLYEKTQASTMLVLSQQRNAWNDCPHCSEQLENYT